MVYRGVHAQMRTAEPLSNEALAMRQLQRADGDGWWTGVLRMRGGEPPREGAKRPAMVRHHPTGSSSSQRT